MRRWTRLNYRGISIVVTQETHQGSSPYNSPSSVLSLSEFSGSIPSDYSEVGDDTGKIPVHAEVIFCQTR